MLGLTMQISLYLLVLLSSDAISEAFDSTPPHEVNSTNKTLTAQGISKTDLRRDIIDIINLQNKAPRALLAMLADHITLARKKGWKGVLFKCRKPTASIM
jgi:hypothetical protein